MPFPLPWRVNNSTTHPGASWAEVAGKRWGTAFRTGVWNVYGPRVAKSVTSFLVTLIETGFWPRRLGRLPPELWSYGASRSLTDGRTGEILSP